MNELAAARGRLYDAVVPAFPSGRFHRYVPTQVVTPCGWIERPRLFPRSEGRSTVTVAVFTVTVAVDGEDVAQQEQLDELVAQVWDRANAAAGVAGSAAPVPLDVGGPTVTGVSVDVEFVIAARSLCGERIIRNGVSLHA